MAVKNDASTGQLMVGRRDGIEVLLQRLASEWQIRVHAGEMRVAYRESICSAVRRTSTHASQLKEGGEVRIEIEVESLNHR